MRSLSKASGRRWGGRTGDWMVVGMHPKRAAWFNRLLDVWMPIPILDDVISYGKLGWAAVRGLWRFTQRNKRKLTRNSLLVSAPERASTRPVRTSTRLSQYFNKVFGDAPS